MAAEATPSPPSYRRDGGDTDGGLLRKCVVRRHNYRAGNNWRGRSAQVCVVAGSVQLSCDGQIVRVHPIRHDRAKEHGAFATPNGRPATQDAPAGVSVKATPPRGRPIGRALTPAPHTGAVNSGAEPPDSKNNVDHVKEVPELMCQAGGGT